MINKSRLTVNSYFSMNSMSEYNKSHVNIIQARVDTIYMLFIMPENSCRAPLPGIVFMPSPGG